MPADIDENALFFTFRLLLLGFVDFGTLRDVQANSSSRSKLLEQRLGLD
jgi:hypothetical protein